jgi:hypothetical protein
MGLPGAEAAGHLIAGTFEAYRVATPNPFARSWTDLRRRAKPRAGGALGRPIAIRALKRVVCSAGVV